MPKASDVFKPIAARIKAGTEAIDVVLRIVNRANAGGIVAALAFLGVMLRPGAVGGNAHALPVAIAYGALLMFTIGCAAYLVRMALIARMLRHVDGKSGWGSLLSELIACTAMIIGVTAGLTAIAMLVFGTFSAQGAD